MSLFFLGLDKLDTLNLDHNKVEVLYDEHFDGMPKVTSLSLDYNKIYDIHPEAFNGLDGKCHVALIRFFVSKLAISHRATAVPVPSCK